MSEVQFLPPPPFSRTSETVSSIVTEIVTVRVTGRAASASVRAHHRRPVVLSFAKTASDSLGCLMLSQVRGPSRSVPTGCRCLAWCMRSGGRARHRPPIRIRRAAGGEPSGRGQIGGSGVGARILTGYAVDQRADLDVDRRATGRSGAGLPTPIELESLTVPGEDGRGLDNDEAGSPARPQPGEPCPENPVLPAEAGSTDGSLQNRRLMRRATFSSETAAELTRGARTKAQTPRTIGRMKFLTGTGVRNKGRRRGEAGGAGW